MRERLTIDDLLDMILDVKICEGECECHGKTKQLDGKLPNGKRIRLMKSRYGYHLSLGHGFFLQDCPDPVDWRQVERRLLPELQGTELSA